MSGSQDKPETSGKDRQVTEAGDKCDQPHLCARSQTKLAWMRTRMNLESTLAAWVRTATSLIGFGFAIEQFFRHFQPAGQRLARCVGLVLIGIGSLATVIAVWEYARMVKYLESEAFRGVDVLPRGLRRIYPVVTVAVLVCLIGLLAFFAILVGGQLPWPEK